MYYSLAIWFVFIGIIAIWPTATKEKNLLSIKERSTFQKRSVISFMYSRLKSTSNTSTCRWLRTFRRQFNLCKRISELSTLILKTRNLTQKHCLKKFEFERWNCTIQPQLFKRVYRETVFIHAMTTSAFTYVIAKACSERTLNHCGCGLEKTPQETHDTWKWGGCGDNVKEGKRLAKKFFEIRRKGDGHNWILKHANDVGIAIVNNTEDYCKCHGVSGSCTLKTCWKRVQPFENIAATLKDRYTTAKRLTHGNSLRKASLKGDKKSDLLYFLAEDRNLCNLTVGRRCSEESNCATLCCGRGSDSHNETITKICNCTLIHAIEVQCNQCNFTETVFTCR